MNTQLLRREGKIVIVWTGFTYIFESCTKYTWLVE